MTEQIQNKTEQCRVVTIADDYYPKRLREIHTPPKQLYYYGDLPREDVPSVAIIGARDCSDYGKYIAMQLGQKLGRAGIQVISGMARGIDGISQSAALEAGGKSYGVLGCGIDICYPPGNRKLYEQLKGNGGILSEYEPDRQPLPGQFPVRNRIVSGLSDAVVVIEARKKSGTLITVDLALEQGRDVYVVPGRLTDALSEGCNRLLKQGAGMLLDMDDFITEIRESFYARTGLQNVKAEPMGKYEQISVFEPELTELECKIYKSVDFTPISVAEISVRAGGELTERELIAVLIQLCLKGFLVQRSPGQFSKKK